MIGCHTHMLGQIEGFLDSANAPVFREKSSCFVPFFIDFNQNRSLSFCPSRFHPANPSFFHIFSRPGFDGPWKNASGRRCCFQFNCKSFWEFSQHIRDPPWTPLVYRSLQRNEVDTQRDVTPPQTPPLLPCNMREILPPTKRRRGFRTSNSMLNAKKTEHRTKAVRHIREQENCQRTVWKKNRLHFVCLPS